jgi:hypothetical protein
MRAHTSGRVTSFVTMSEMQCAGVRSYILQGTMLAMQCVPSSRKTYPCQNKHNTTHATRNSIICTQQYNSENNRIYAITPTPHVQVEQPHVSMQWISGNYYPKQKVSESGLFLNSIKQKGHLWIYNLLRSKIFTEDS